MANFQSGMDEYLAEITRLTGGQKGKRQEYLLKIRSSLLEIPDVESLSFQELCEILGPPEMAVDAFLDEGAKRKIQRAMLIRKAVLVVLLVLAIIGTIMFAQYVAKTYDYTHGTDSYTGAQYGTPPPQSDAIAVY